MENEETCRNEIVNHHKEMINYPERVYCVLQEHRDNDCQHGTSIYGVFISYQDAVRGLRELFEDYEDDEIEEWENNYISARQRGRYFAGWIETNDLIPARRQKVEQKEKKRR